MKTLRFEIEEATGREKLMGWNWRLYEVTDEGRFATALLAAHRNAEILQEMLTARFVRGDDDHDSD